MVDPLPYYHPSCDCCINEGKTSKEMVLQQGSIQYQNNRDNQETYRWPEHVQSRPIRDEENRAADLSTLFVPGVDSKGHPCNYEQGLEQTFSSNVEVNKSSYQAANEEWQLRAMGMSTETRDSHKLPQKRPSLYSASATITTDSSTKRNSQAASHEQNTFQPNSRLTTSTSIQSTSMSSVYTPTTSSKLPSDNLSCASTTNNETNFYPYNSTRELIDTSRAQTITNDLRYNTDLLMGLEQQNHFPSMEESHLNANTSNPVASSGAEALQQQQQHQQLLPNSYQSANSADYSSNFIAYSAVTDYTFGAPGVNSRATDNGGTYYSGIQGSQQTTEISSEGVFCYDKRASKCTATMAVTMAFEQDHSSSSPIKYPSSLRSDAHSYGNCTDSDMSGKDWLTIDSTGRMLPSQARLPRFERHEVGLNYGQQEDYAHSNLHSQKQPNVLAGEPTTKYEDYSGGSAYRNDSRLTTDGPASFNQPQPQPQRHESLGSIGNAHLVHERALERSAAHIPITY